MNFTQKQLDATQLPIRGKRIKLEVLDRNLQTLATLEGNVIGGSLQKDATSFVRRSGSIQMCIPNIKNATTFLDYVDGVVINVNGKIWLDKAIKILVGIDDYIQPSGVSPQTIWYSFGLCLIDQPVRTFGADGYTMSFNLIDVSARLNGDRGGQMASATTLFPRVSGYSFSSFVSTPFSGESPSISTVIESRYDYNRVYVSSGSDLAIYYKNLDGFGPLISTPLSSSLYTLSPIVECPQNDGFVVCVAAGNKLAVANGQTMVFGTSIQAPFLINRMTGLYGVVYCGGTTGDFVVFNPTNGTFGSTVTTPFEYGIRAMEEDENYVYCASANGEFAIYTKATGTFGSLINTPFSGNAPILFCSTQDENCIYLGGARGLAIYNKTTGTMGGLINTPNNVNIVSITQPLFEYRGNITTLLSESPQVYCGCSSGELLIFDKTLNEFMQTPSSPFVGSTAATTHSLGEISGIYVDVGMPNKILVYCGSFSGGFAIYGNTPFYTKTYDAMVACISELATISRYTIYPIPQKWEFLPYDIKLTVGATIYSALEQFLAILSGWQMYFDNEGIFVVEPIPSGANDIVYPINLKLNTIDVNSADFNNVRNQVIVYGRGHNIDFMGDLTVDGNNTVITFDNFDVTKIQAGSTVFGFRQSVAYCQPLEIGYNKKVTISYIENNQRTTKEVYITGMDLSDMETKTEQLIKDVVYVFRIRNATTIVNDNELKIIDFEQDIQIEYLGRQQAQASMVNGNPESPYSVVKPYLMSGTATNAYYGEFVFVSANEITLEYTISLSSPIPSLPNGAIILCYLPKNEGYDIIRLYIQNITGGTVNAPIDGAHKQQFGGDYTLWALKYFVGGGSNYFQILGRCPYVNTLVESGGEFDNIYADVLAQERAEYDLFLHTNLQNTITLSCVPDYSLDVNYRIKYNQSSAVPPDAQIDETFEDRYFITKQVTYPLGLDETPQSINAIEIYDDFNYVGYAYDVPTGS